MIPSPDLRPKSAATPVGAGAEARSVNASTKHIARRGFNTIEGRLVAGVRLFPRVRELVRPLGPELFQCEYHRELARVVLTGEPVRLEYAASIDFQWVEEDVRLFMASTDEAWALHLLGLLVRDRERPILAATLRWGADALESGQPFRHVVRQVATAFRRARLGKEAA